MIVTLNRKIRDRIPAPVPEMPKKCSPPRPGTGGRRGRKPNTAAVPASQLSDVAPARFSLPPQIKAVVEAAGQGILRSLLETLEKAYATSPEGAVSRLLERDIPNWARHAGRAAMEAIMLHERGFLGSTLVCPECEEGFLRFQGDRPRGVRTMCGQIDIRRSYYVCNSCRKSVAPLDLQLGLDGTPDSPGDSGFLPGVQEVVALAGSRLSFPDATRLIAKVLPDPPSLRTLERITRALGSAVQRERNRERREAYQDPANSKFPACEATTTPEVAVVAVDGGMCRMRSAAEPYREFKMAVLGSLNPIPGRKKEEPPPFVLNKAYTATFEGPDEVFRFCGLEFARLGLDRASVVQVLADGAPWIWNRTRDLAQPGQRLVETLDFYHACDHIREAAHAFFGPDSKKGRAWQKARQAQLLAGRLGPFFTSLDRLAQRADKLGRAPEAETIRDEKAYFHKRRRLLNYKRCLDDGLLIGSGMIEGGIRFIGKDRLHRTGMRWSEAGAEGILALRCLESSGRWERFCESREQARAARYQAFRWATARAA